jgi:glutamate carboxypeptidase
VRDLIAVCQRERRWLVDLIAELAACESPSTDPEALERCAVIWAARVAEAGAAVSRLPAVTTADHILAEWPGNGPPVLLIGHFDTVWPVGQIARMPVREADGRLYGPGVFDMKAGLAIGLLAVRALIEAGAAGGRPRVRFLATSDEEVGSHTSRAAIESLARESSAVLVLEPALTGGALKTARKGVGEFQLITHGISSHAGVDPGAGASAVHELARQILAVEAFNDPARGVSVNVGVIEGGTRSNVVAEIAKATVDVRVSRIADAADLEARFRRLATHDPRVRLEVRGGINRPPMERTAGVAALFEVARAVALDMGFALQEGMTGGASDGNFTAALGVPTLDGMGATGDGAHALHEHVVVDDLPIRAAIAAGVLQRLAAWAGEFRRSARVR